MNTKEYTYSKKIEHSFEQQMNEIAQINDPILDSNIMPSSYCVSLYPNDHKPPHFHYENKDGMDIKVDIKTLDVIDSVARKNIKSKHLLSWLRLKKEHKILLKWLDQKNNDFPSQSNYETIKSIWNLYHKDKKI